MTKKFEIQNSTSEFLIFQIEGKEDGVQVVYRDESIWCTQKTMTQLFDVGVSAISKHKKNESMYSKNFHRRLSTSYPALT